VTQALKSTQLSAYATISHGFWGREGGSSSGVFASLNCGYGSDDDPVLIRRNRQIVAESLGTDTDRLITAYQVHSADVVRVEKPWLREHAPHGDAMVTCVPGIALGVLAADCAPVLFADPEAGVVGCAHAGWQGAFKGVVDAVVAAMEHLGARRSRIHAEVGPCISQKNYEVGPEFRERFASLDAGLVRFFVPSPRADHWMFDLPAFVSFRLEQSAIGSFSVLGACTYELEGSYFSYRRTTHRKESQYGRNISAIMLKP
jgi:YfiH family protein